MVLISLVKVCIYDLVTIELGKVSQVVVYSSNSNLFTSIKIHNAVRSCVCHATFTFYVFFTCLYYFSCLSFYVHLIKAIHIIFGSLLQSIGVPTAPVILSYSRGCERLPKINLGILIWFFPVQLKFGLLLIKCPRYSCFEHVARNKGISFGMVTCMPLIDPEYAHCYYLYNNLSA